MSIAKRVILAAGHGGGDSGAAAQGSTEYVENIQITDKVAYYLRQAGGIEIHVVPHTLNLGPSIDWVNARFKNVNDGIAIEIHKNAGGGTGSEVWTPSHPDATAKAYSQTIADHLAKATGLPNRGVKYAQNNRWGRLGWCDDTNTYACLVEAGFIDVDPINDEMDNKYARGIANGILAYFGLPQSGGAAPKPTPQPAPAPRKSNEVIATEVLAGAWGNNPERRSRLQAAGYNPDTIQGIVNARLGGVKGPVPAPARPSVDAVADQVIAGAWGNGPDRQARLQNAGYNYAEVQAAVNRKMGLGAAPTRKSSDQVANEIIAGQGGWGNNPQRADKLRAAGYDPNAVQQLVNRKLGF